MTSETMDVVRLLSAVAVAAATFQGVSAVSQDSPLPPRWRDYALACFISGVGASVFAWLVAPFIFGVF